MEINKDRDGDGKEDGGSEEKIKNQGVKKTNQEKNNEEIAKITVSKEAEEKVSLLLKRVNEGFESGRLNRQDLASWALIRFYDECDDATIEAIRTDHFDQFMMFEAVLKKAKEDGSLPPEYQALLKQQFGHGSTGRQKQKKSLTRNSINDGV